MKNNYSVYQHVTPDNMHYFGATQNVERRWRNNGAEYKRTALQPYIEKFGWDNIQHIVLFENQSKEDALSIEDSLIISGWEKGNCINKQRSGNISKEEGYYREYYEQNKQQMRKQQKQYYEENKQQIQEQNKQYYEENKNKRLEYQQQYYEQNKNKRLEYQQQYYEQNKDKKQQYYEQNKQQIRKQQKQYYEQNKQRMREYQRQYYQRKKEENQFEELGCLPLW